MASIAENLTGIRERIREALETAGRPAGSARLLAVSKTFPFSDAAEAYEAGQREFGENRVQELETKVPLSPPGMIWHLIGHLQSNKAQKAVELADWIHSVDSLKLASRLAAAAEKLGRHPNILLEANVSGEESKFGIREYDTLREIAEYVSGSPFLELKGLMTMAPQGADEEMLHRTFGGLRERRDRLERELNITLPELSMGMSGDFPAAIREGATIVRVGTAIFGGRSYPEKPTA